MADQTETPVIAPKASVTAPVKGFQDGTPSNWEITKVDENSIVAVSGLTLERFEGTIEDFNKRLRG